MTDTASSANHAAFDTYYDKPAWWFRLRYDTQIKRKTCAALCRRAKSDWNGCTVFELGFGAGDTLLTFPPSCRIEGVEISDSAIRLAQSRLVRAGFREPALKVWSASALELGANRLDCIILSHVLEHVPDESVVLSALFKALKPGGCLVVLVPINERHHDPNHARSYTTASCRAAVERAGFRQAFGLEHEWIFYLVEKLYWSHTNRPWTVGSNAARWSFNLLTACWPFWLCRAGDRLVAAVTGLPPRQSAMLFRKP